MFDLRICPHERREILTASKDRCVDCGEVFSLSKREMRKRQKIGAKAIRDLVIKPGR